MTAIPAPTLSRRARKRRNATIRAAEDFNLTTGAYAVLCAIAINAGPSTTTEVLPDELIALEAAMIGNAARVNIHGDSRSLADRKAIAAKFATMFDDVWGRR